MAKKRKKKKRIKFNLNKSSLIKHLNEKERIHRAHKDAAFFSFCCVAKLSLVWVDWRLCRRECEAVLVVSW